MKKASGSSIRLLLTGMLMLSVVFSMSCAFRQVRVIPADRMIKPLPSGNYEVTPAWLKDRYEYELWMKEQLKRCQGD
jgi:hypothetical protein